MTGCFPCVSWSTSLWPTPCWWSTRLSTVLTISPTRWGSGNLRAAAHKTIYFCFLSSLFWTVFESHSFLNCQGALNINERTIPQPRLLQLSVEKLSREGAFLMDAGTVGHFRYCCNTVMTWCMFLCLTPALFSFIKGNLFVDWEELQSHLPHTSSWSSQLCCCAWQPGKKACAAAIMLSVYNILKPLIYCCFLTLLQMFSCPL